MSREVVDHWLSMTQETMDLLHGRRVSGAEVDLALVRGIDIALAKLPSFAATLKTSKNAVKESCAARVPKEVFEEIIKHAMTIAPIVLGRGQRGDLGWVKLSHICRAWRMLAIGCEKVWASSVGLLPLATAAFQLRAGSTPIDVEISGERPLLPSQALAYTPVDVGHVGVILRNIDLSRVRSLKICDGRVRVWRFARALDLHGAFFSLSNLTHLELQDYSWNIKHAHASFLAEGNFQLQAPNLETLILKNCFMVLSCRNLSSVVIEYDGDLLPRPGASVFASALADCPSLKTLRVLNALSPQVVVDLTQQPFDLSELVDLPVLEYLSVTGPAHSVEGLLVLLCFPRETVVHVDACIWPSGAPDITRQLARTFQEHLMQDFATVAVDQFDQCTQEITRVRMWKSATLTDVMPAIRFGACADEGIPMPHFDVTVRNHVAGQWATVVNSFARRVRADSVRSLALALPSAAYAAGAVARWIGILDRFPKLAVLFPKRRLVRSLNVIGQEIAYLADAFAAAAPLVSDVLNTQQLSVDVPHLLDSGRSIMPNAIAIYPNEPCFGLGPALASRDNVTWLMDDLDLPCDDRGKIGDEAIAEFLGCEVRRVCNFFDPKRTAYQWHYSMYAGSTGDVNDVANVVRKDKNTVIRGTVVVVKDAPERLWSASGTTVSVRDLAAAIWSYHRTGMDAAQVYGDRSLVRWLGSSE
ncbi:hypothetical protein K488DRAFT_73391 [Vararia minispora EC-137]|uniref:Uncharacterized protein n=1 Tax=Vararia minispora EC-137 TaxID=1314806 RepID=A0ACB8QB41_9AGAM|nr:hypothetical protein K488DRAFT_73391 [Vararia minispora EC-137]